LFLGFATTGKIPFASVDSSLSAPRPTRLPAARFHQVGVKAVGFAGVNFGVLAATRIGRQAIKQIADSDARHPANGKVREWASRLGCGLKIVCFERHGLVQIATPPPACHAA
jgi:hypothetical protein